MLSQNPVRLSNLDRWVAGGAIMLVASYSTSASGYMCIRLWICDLLNETKVLICPSDAHMVFLFSHFYYVGFHSALSNVN